MPSELATRYPSVLFDFDDGSYSVEENCGANGGACVHAEAGEEDYCSYDDVTTNDVQQCPGENGGLYCGDSDDKLYRCWDGKYTLHENCRVTHGGSTSFGICEENPDPNEDDYCDDPPPVAEAESEAAAAAPVEEAPTSALLHSNVRLKMFWDDDYYWQESSDESWWCIERDVPGDDCWHYNDREVDCDPNKVYIMECGGTSRQRFDLVDVTGPSGITEVLIRVTGQDRCLRRDGYGDDDVELVWGCDPADDLQRWAAVRGSLTGEKFELGRVDDEEAMFCLSQAHHPKEGEDVRMYDCDEERDGDTSYWVTW